MKFQLDAALSGNVLSRVEPGCVWVNGVAHQSAVVVPWAGEVKPWDAADLSALTADHFTRLAAYKPELVLFSSGSKQRFVHPSLVGALISQGIGIETMALNAACRTYNVLTSEGRKVVAALLLA
jgi:uncharacterized protein